MITEMEKTAMEYCVRTGQARYVNRLRDQRTQEEYLVVATFKGAKCVAYAKDGKLFRSIHNEEFFEVPTEM